MKIRCLSANFRPALSATALVLCALQICKYVTGDYAVRSDTYLTYTRQEMSLSSLSPGGTFFHPTPFHDKENRIRLLKVWINAVYFIYLFIRAGTSEWNNYRSLFPETSRQRTCLSSTGAREKINAKKCPTRSVKLTPWIFTSKKYIYAYETDQNRALNVQRTKFCDENSLSFCQFSSGTFCDSTRSFRSANMQIRDRGLRCEIKDTYLTYTRQEIPLSSLSRVGAWGFPLPLFTTKKIEFDS
ncbi:hypothetical protein CEXT_227621 [Caerostris extrusa]|uniref:Uncharacterized protein n=1 Tax=Caerostris extrusa TaxID=172846 RepID=A0AAV4QX64_CAEEX|nr:hypothetical protein CEXT_227621 [Caerostris extrusa]